MQRKCNFQSRSNCDAKHDVAHVAKCIISKGWCVCYICNKNQNLKSNPIWQLQILAKSNPIWQRIGNFVSILTHFTVWCWTTSYHCGTVVPEERPNYSTLYWQRHIQNTTLCPSYRTLQMFVLCIGLLYTIRVSVHVLVRVDEVYFDSQTCSQPFSIEYSFSIIF